MGLNQTQSAERVHIGFFGDRNAGKSSIVNAITGQSTAVVSELAGTTTDPVKKTMELLPIGPVVIIDTPGFDDEGILGKKRVMTTKSILNMTDIAVLVIDSSKDISNSGRELITIFEENNIPYITVYNKSDLLDTVPANDEEKIYVSTLTGDGIHELKEMIGKMYSVIQDNDMHKLKYIADFVHEGDYIILVVPIDSAAPKGRLILPQQQAIREILDVGGRAIVVKENALKEALDSLGVRPKLVITDSQVFEEVNKLVPKEIPLTSFSILMARYKGFLDMAYEGADVIGRLADGDKVLICEGCTHHRQCDDIGTVKLPKWLNEYTGCELDYEFTSGHGFPEDLSGYKLIIHCGGCMINEREVRYRMKCAANQGIPVSNYGIAIAYMKGILDRSTEIIYNLV